MSDYDTAYYARRETTEREIAARAINPKIRDIHLRMARHYAELASIPPQRQRLALASG